MQLLDNNDKVKQAEIYIIYGIIIHNNKSDFKDCKYILTYTYYRSSDFFFQMQKQSLR